MEAEGIFVKFALGDVEEIADEGGGRLVFVEDDVGEVLEPAVFAGAGAEAVMLLVVGGLGLEVGVDFGFDTGEVFGVEEGSEAEVGVGEFGGGVAEDGGDVGGDVADGPTWCDVPLDKEDGTYIK